MKTNAMTEEFEHIELFGKPVLLTDSRIDRSTVPNGWHCYDIRGSDSDPGMFDTLEKSVSVNHAGSILSPQEIQFPKGEDYRRISDSQNFLGESLTLAEFCQAHGLSTPAGNGLHQQVRDWYMAEYPTDELAPSMNEVTFCDIVENLNAGRDIYEALGAADSIMRERVFGRTADLLQVDYDVIFNKWVHNEMVPDIELPEQSPEYMDMEQGMTLGGM